MIKVLDYTKMRLSKKQKIVKCPRCNRKGELHKYVTGAVMIIHRSQIELGMFNNVKDCCYFTKEENIK